MFWARFVLGPAAGEGAVAHRAPVGAGIGDSRLGMFPEELHSCTVGLPGLVRELQPSWREGESSESWPWQTLEGSEGDKLATGGSESLKQLLGRLWGVDLTASRAKGCGAVATSHPLGSQIQMPLTHGPPSSSL